MIAKTPVKFEYGNVEYPAYVKVFFFQSPYLEVYSNYSQINIPAVITSYFLNLSKMPQVVLQASLDHPDLSSFDT